MDLLARGIAIGMGLEPLSCNEVVPINYEQTLFQALVNEGRVSSCCVILLRSTSVFLFRPSSY